MSLVCKINYVVIVEAAHVYGKNWAFNCKSLMWPI